MTKEQRAKRDHRLFMQRSLSAYNNMTARCGKLPFTVVDLRELIADRICLPCPYMGTTVTVKDFSLDHKTPVSRGGLSSLDNLVVCSKGGTLTKGILTSEEFQALMAILDEFPQEARGDVIGRLKAGGATKRLRFFGKKKAAQ